jgi:TPR repeat protein
MTISIKTTILPLIGLTIFCVAIIAASIVLSATPDESVRKLIEQAESGDIKAQYNLGICYADGKGVDKDCIQSAQCYRKALGQEYPQDNHFKKIAIRMFNKEGEVEYVQDEKCINIINKFKKGKTKDAKSEVLETVIYTIIFFISIWFLCVCRVRTVLSPIELYWLVSRLRYLNFAFSIMILVLLIIFLQIADTALELHLITKIFDTLDISRETSLTFINFVILALFIYLIYTYASIWFVARSLQLFGSSMILILLLVNFIYDIGGFSQVYLLALVIFYLRQRAMKILRTSGCKVGFWGLNINQFLTQKYPSYTELGFQYLKGENIPRNPSKAVKCFRKAAEQGDTAALTAIGVCYLTGCGVSQNAKEAFKWYCKAAEQGEAAAQSNLGNCYKYGIGVDKNLEEAVKWYRKSAEQEFDTAQHELGIFYMKGEGVQKDNEEAIKWIRKAAEQENVKAQNTLGVCYRTGLGVAKNLEEAFKWYCKAAEKGDEEAQYNLGLCYEYGEGVTKNLEEAVKWYRLSAEQGHALGQFNLGVCYKNGDGVTQDNVEAIKWIGEAAKQGLSHAITLLVEMGLVKVESR